MTIVVETGAGDPLAESYNSVDEIDSYNAAHNVDAVWTAGSAPDKERWARLATQYIEAEWGPYFLGRRATTSQALAWPRAGVELDQRIIPISPLPRQLKEAHAELAIRAASAPLISDQATPGSITLERVKVDVIEIETQFGGAGRAQAPVFKLVDSLLGPLAADSGALVRC